MTTEKSQSRLAFEGRVWALYRGKKDRGWWSYAEGDSENPDALFWRQDDGRYGVHAIEQAWQGWQLAKADSAAEMRVMYEHTLAMARATE